MNVGDASPDTIQQRSGSRRRTLRGPRSLPAARPRNSPLHFELSHRTFAKSLANPGGRHKVSKTGGTRGRLASTEGVGRSRSLTEVARLRSWLWSSNYSSDPHGDESRGVADRSRRRFSSVASDGGVARARLAPVIHRRAADLTLRRTEIEKNRIGGKTLRRGGSLRRETKRPCLPCDPTLPSLSLS